MVALVTFGKSADVWISQCNIIVCGFQFCKGMSLALRCGKVRV